MTNKAKIPAKLKGYHLVRKISLGMISVGLLSFFGGAIAFGFQSRWIWSDFLVNNVFFTLTSLAAIMFFTIHVIARSDWIFSISRVLKAVASFLPAGIAGFILLFFNLKVLYPWTDTALYADFHWFKQWYLDINPFITRNLLYFTGWLILAYLILRQLKDKEGHFISNPSPPLLLLSSAFVVFFTLTSSPFIWDWLISIDVFWYTTLYAWYVIIGAMISGTSVTLLLVLWFKKSGVIVPERTLANLGNYLFTFCCIWIYMWYSQFMLIWYGNLPEEALYYIQRVRGSGTLFYGNIMLNFAIPFLLLIPLRAKKNVILLSLTSIICFIGQWIDKYLLIIPGLEGSTGNCIWLTLGLALGFLGLSGLIIYQSLKSYAV